MKSIGSRFSIVVGIFALAFSGIVLYRTWSSTRQRVEELTSEKAQLALEFDLAIREYVKEQIRPKMEDRTEPDEFVVEAMSTSYIAREIVEMYHGEEAVQPAEEAFIRVFQEKGTPEEMGEYSLKAGESLVEVMVASGVASSKSEARRLIEQRGVRIDGEVVEDEKMRTEFDQPVVLRVGKRRFVKLIPA